MHQTVNKTNKGTSKKKKKNILKILQGLERHEGELFF